MRTHLLYCVQVLFLNIRVHYNIIQHYNNRKTIRLLFLMFIVFAHTWFRFLLQWLTIRVDANFHATNKI